MSFNTALSGLSAASSELSVTGNNIANGSTVGFKASRAEFADVYASTLLGTGANGIGSGVKLANVAQLFDQGTISFTNNSLDLAIDGGGFFVLSDQGSRAYTRAGMFGVNDGGFLVSNSGAHVQGFTASATGSLSGVLGDLQLRTSNLAPRQTSLVEGTLNLDARQSVLATVGTTIATTGAAVGVAQAGAPGITNGYLAQTVDVVQPDGSLQAVSIPANSSAAQTAALFGSSNAAGLTATAETTATLTAAGFTNASGTMTLSLNGVALTGSTLVALANAITSTPGLGTATATIDTNGDLIVTDRVGNDLTFTVTGGTAADSVSVLGAQGSAVAIDTTGNTTATIGGAVTLTMTEGVTIANAVPATTNLFGALDASAFTPFELNTFDPQNQDTFNHATSMTLFDSLGNPHVMTTYFVKQRFTPGVPGEEANRWNMYVLIDGQDIGDPDPNLPPPQNSDPTRARFQVRFNPDGSLNQAGSDTILISNWIPLDPNGQPNGAVGPQNVLAGGGLPVADPPTSSNFEVRLNDTTQYGSEFNVSRIDQNGFTTGQISGLNIDTRGVVVARFTNGQNQVLGQIALADFGNVQGLNPIGNTAWVQTNDSGEPVIGAPGAGSLGAITSGALEDSNVELSEQLVQLILAQRNFQANARTISTADEITQTIINI